MWGFFTFCLVIDELFKGILTFDYENLTEDFFLMVILKVIFCTRSLLHSWLSLEN